MLKNNILVVIEVYGANTELGILTIVCKLKSFINFSLIFTFVLSTPNKNPSGNITAHLPSCFNLYIIRVINRSNVSDPLKFEGKFACMFFTSCPP